MGRQSLEPQPPSGDFGWVTKLLVSLLMLAAVFGAYYLILSSIGG